MQVALGTVIQSSATIANGQTTSGAITTNGLSLVGVLIPAAFTGTSIGFTMCETVGGTYVPMKNKSGTTIAYTVAQGNYYTIDPSDFYGVPFFKVVSNASEGAARNITCAMKGI